jgi:serine/threonine protein kinase
MNFPLSFVMADQTISHYRILSQLGSGGMGVVYEAQDLDLGRKVALKFLPPQLSRDQNALDRFLLEARAASALNHPNICTIYAVEKSGEQSFIAMELLEGETLDRRMRNTPSEVLRFGLRGGSSFGGIGGECNHNSSTTVGGFVVSDSRGFIPEIASR